MAVAFAGNSTAIQEMFKRRLPQWCSRVAAGLPRAGHRGFEVLMRPLEVYTGNTAHVVIIQRFKGGHVDF